MKPLAHHMCGLAVCGLIASTASGQELTADRSGMGDLPYFAEHCLDTAPSFDATRRYLQAQIESADLRQFSDAPKLALIERDANCVYAASFFDWHTHLPNVIQNLHYVVKEEARLAWRSAAKEPTKITLDFDGTEAFVSIGYRETITDGVLVVSTMIEREGSCPV